MTDTDRWTFEYPGYWQHHVDDEVAVSVDPKSHEAVWATPDFYEQIGAVDLAVRRADGALDLQATSTRANRAVTLARHIDSFLQGVDEPTLETEDLGGLASLLLDGEGFEDEDAIARSAFSLLEFWVYQRQAAKS